MHLNRKTDHLESLLEDAVALELHALGGCTGTASTASFALLALCNLESAL